MVGRGRVGRSLAAALVEAPALRVTLVSSRALAKSLRADVVVLACPDRAIEDAARAVLEQTSGVSVVLHCAGALGAEAYGELPREWASVAFGAMHPLVSFADPARPPPLGGTAFALAGPPRARQAGERLARACGAEPMGKGPAGLHGAAYHAAAALVANGAAALAFVGVGILRERGLSKAAAERALAGLLESVAHNLRAVGVPRALTGPVMRGDRGTVERHRGALGPATDARRAYDAVVPLIERCAAALQPKSR